MYILIINSTIFVFYIIALITDQFKLSSLITIVFFLLYIINSLYDYQSQTIILNAVMNPIIVLLGCLGIIGDIYNSSYIKQKIAQHYIHYTNPHVFHFSFLITTFFLSAIINNSLIVSSFIPILNLVVDKFKPHSHTTYYNY